MRKQDYYEPSIGRESEPRRRPKKKKKRANRGERVVVTLLSLLFLTVAIVATVKYVVRAPEPVTDNEDQQTQQDGTAEDSDAIQRAQKILLYDPRLRCGQRRRRQRHEHARAL